MTIESSTPLVISHLGVEGSGMMLQSIRGYWLQENAGGCKNHPTFGKNPAWQLNVKSDCEMIVRLCVLEQFAPLKSQDPENFKICVQAQLFRVNATIFPMPADKI